MKLIPLLDCIPSVIQYCAMASHNRNVKTNAGQSIHSGLKCNYMNKNCFVTTRTSALMIFFSSPEPRCDCPPPPPPTPFVSFSNRRINPWIALVLKNLIDTDWEQFINRSNEANKFDRALHDSTISQAEAGVYLHICPQRGGVHVRICIWMARTSEPVNHRCESPPLMDGHYTVREAVMWRDTPH